MLSTPLASGAKRSLRAAVVGTRDWPLLSSVYRAAYSVQTRRVTRALRAIEGVDTVLLRGSTVGRVHPGLSDIDLVVLLDEGAPKGVLLRACETVFRRVARVNLGAPLIRDVHVFTHPEIDLLARAGSGLYWGILHDSVPVAGRSRLDGLSIPGAAVHEALVRELWLWQSHTLRHMMDGGEVGRGLAGRAFAKAFSAASVLEAGGDLEALWQSYARGTREAVDTGRSVEMLRTLDAALPGAPRPDDSRAPTDPGLRSIQPAIESWTHPLRKLPALTGALLSLEGTRKTDTRLYIVIDPEHPRASQALDRICTHFRTSGFPCGRSFSRFPWPLIVTPRQAERTVLARWTAVEPLLRARHGVHLWGATGPPRATAGEIARSLVLDGLGSIARLRKLLCLRVTPRKAAYLQETMRGLFPTLKALADSQPIPVWCGSQPMWLNQDPTLRRRESRLALCEQIDEIVSQVMPRVLDSALEKARGRT